MNDCLFCKILAGDIPSAKVYEDENVYAFRDIAPQAPTHILVIPKTHIASADEITAETAPLVAAVFATIPKIAAAEGLDKGYRVITNVGEHGCQSVKHLHFHLLGGAQLPESMGV
jgi:histidine triad (HIT) family protein